MQPRTDDPLVTRPSLLVKVRDARDSAAWGRFVGAYTPIVFGFCRRRGLQAADAADVAQDVMGAVAKAMASFEYDPEKGKFRDWLFRVTRNKLTDFVRKRDGEAMGSGATGVQQRLEAEPAEEETTWDEQWRKHAFERAAGEVREEFAEGTWKAFWGVAVEGREVKEVAGELGMSAGAVYIARSRVTARLKRAVEEMESEC